MSTPPVVKDRRAVLAACAIALATAVGANGSDSATELQAVEKIQHYCSVSWRNAGIRNEEWDDFTQQTLLELLSQVSREKLPTAIQQSQSDERRELNRAVWRMVQRWRRAPRPESFDERHTLAGQHSESLSASDHDWNEVAAIAEDVLSERQMRIIDLTRDGWGVAEIARKLNMSAARVSDEKYKAIAKLRERLA